MSQEEYKKNNQAFTEDESGLDYRNWMFHFLRYWYLFLIAALIALGIAAFKNKSWIPIHLTSGTMVMEGGGRTSGVGSIAVMQGFGLQSGYKDLQNQTAMMMSYDFLGRVVDSLPFFQVDYITKGRFKTRNIYKRTPIYITPEYISSDAYKYLFKITVKPTGEYFITLDNSNKNNYGSFEAHGVSGETLRTSLFVMKLERLSNENNDIEMFFQFKQKEQLVNEFLNRLQIGYVENTTSILKISLVSATPARDVDFINKLSDVFISENLELKNAVAVKTIDFIDSQLGTLQRELKKSEDELTNFRQNNQIMNVSNYVSNVLSMANSNDIKKIELETKEQYLDYLENYLNENITKDAIMVPPSIAIDDSRLVELIQKTNSNYLLLSEITEKHLSYEAIQKETENIRIQISEVIRSIRLSLKLESDQLEKRMKEVNKKIEALPQKEVDMVSIEREYRVNDSYYTFFLQKRSEAEIQKASNRSDNSVLDKARTLYMVNRDATQKLTIKYLMFGLLIPFVFVLLLKLLNTKATTVSEIEKMSAFPVIGTIRRTNKKDPMLLIKKPRSSFAEMFRVLRTRLEFIIQRKTNIMIAVSSAESGDGKTYFSANLAAVYAVTQKKTLLIDLDIRKPDMYKLFGVNNESGITNYLFGEANLKEVIKKTENEYYDILTAGLIPPNPGEIVRSDKLKQLFDELKEEYDYIIIDTSPIGLVADAYPIMLMSDLTLFVTRLNKTKKQGIKRVTEQLKQDNVPHVYTFVNDVNVEERHHSKYGYSHYKFSKLHSKKKRIEAENRSQYYRDDEDI